MDADEDQLPVLGSYVSVDVDAPPLTPLIAITFPLPRRTIAKPDRVLAMLPVDVHDPVVRSYSSQLVKYPVPLVPPHAKTLPLPSNVAPKSARAVLIEPVDDQPAASNPTPDMLSASVTKPERSHLL
jgi:hypothetical protein